MNPLGEKKTAALAKDIYDYLIANDLWFDCAIYFNGKRWSTYGTAGTGKSVIEEKADPHDYTGNAGDILTVIFEGPLYEALNYSDDYTVDEELSKIFEQYGCYYAFGEAWNITAIYDERNK